MELSDSKRDRARRIVTELYSPPNYADGEELLMDADLRAEVEKDISNAHELYIDLITGKALLRTKMEYETGYEKAYDYHTLIDRMVIFLLYILYRHPYIQEELRTGKPAGDVEVSQETILRIAEKAKLNKTSVDRSISRLSRLGYLEGTLWPRKIGYRMRALPPALFEKIEESAFLWQMITEAGLETEKAELDPAMVISSDLDNESSDHGAG
jgi:hypothetical protein